MGSKMLIDAAHPEETRVAVVRGNRIEEFDYESASRKQLKGNIYLAKVTRVEPSLQAAFVDYGGNRHGFLAFSEIHPDYYQIPVADREALLREEEEEESHISEDVSSVSNDAASDVVKPDDDDDDTDAETDADVEAANIEIVEEEENGDAIESVSEEADEEEEVEEEAPRRRRKRQRRYRIQEVIKRRQIILVQVVKEERGNKGAALTTYLSLAGRYCVLMPNTARGGGISRKINDPKDRKRLKAVVEAINVPEGAGLIVRTAGAARTKAEIKRDFDYLLRLWGNIRELTLESSAPSMVHEEGNLIKRSIRDLYNKEVDEVMVDGEAAYKDAKAFMKMLMPSHARNVKLYKETRPLFSRFQVENQLDALYSPTVNLQSGGYLVMNQTEALVAIDINSGRATREHSIEKTALKTNLEAAAEIARQLRLRDLAGLVVIDFIDMEERRNNRAVERKLKESLKTDRARIQVGRISHFGLLEMSRQRMRQSMLEGTTKPCTLCEGTGLIRSLSSSALTVLRKIEDHLINRNTENLNVKCHNDVACYVLNDKRDHLRLIEKAYGVSIFLLPSDGIAVSDCEISQGNDRGLVSEKRAEKATETQPEKSGSEEEKTKPRRSRRSRRGKRGGRGRNNDETTQAVTETAPQEAVKEPQAEETGVEGKAEEKPKRKRNRRPRKRKASTDSKPEVQVETETAASETAETVQETAKAVETEVRAEPQPDEKAEPKQEEKAESKPARKKPARKRSRKKKPAAEAEAKSAESKPEQSAPEKPVEKPEPVKDVKSPVKEEPRKEPEKSTWQPPKATEKQDAPVRKGWWSK